MNIVTDTTDLEPTASATPEPSSLFHLTIASALTPATDVERPDRVSDLAAFYYWKDAIVTGSYVHPAGQFTLEITRDRLDGFVNTFNHMRDNGVGVPILMDHAPTAESTLGWIVDVRREGDRLLELHQFLGESARDIGLRNKVSLGIDPHFVDGKGNQYGEAIVHSAVTPMPVVPGQGEYFPVELSLVSKETLAGRAASPVVVASTPAVTGAAPAMDVSQDLSQAVSQHLSLALSQVISMKRDLALARGGVDAAVAQEIFDLLVPASDAVHLSRTASNGMPIAMAVFDALSRNRPVTLGEATGLQVLARSIPGEDGTVADLRERMIALASGR